VSQEGKSSLPSRSPSHAQLVGLAILDRGVGAPRFRDRGDPVLPGRRGGVSRIHRLQITMVTTMVLSQILCGGCPLRELSLRLRGAHSHGTFLAPLLARWLGIPVPEVVITIMTLSALLGSLLGWSLWRPPRRRSRMTTHLSGES